MVGSDLGELDSNGIRPNSISVLLRENDACQVLHCGLESQQCVLGPLAEAFVNVWVELWRPDVKKDMKTPKHRSEISSFNVCTQFDVTGFDELAFSCGPPSILSYLHTAQRVLNVCGRGARTSSVQQPRETKEQIVWLTIKDEFALYVSIQKLRLS